MSKGSLVRMKQLTDDWLDNLLDGEPSGITDTQWFIIENNIDGTSLPSSMISEIINKINDLSEVEANEIINLINENKTERDPRKQWIEMRKKGVFKHRDF